jgi:hypothetical protein
MQPRELPAGDRRRRLLEVVLRLLALSLTLTLVLSVAGVAMNLAAWQCPAARATCSDRQVFLRFLGQGFWHQPGRRVALAALVPTALVWLLWYFGTRTWRGNEQVTRPQGTILAAPLPLQRRELWNGGEPVRRLRRVQVAAALAVVAGLAAFPARQHLAAGRAWSDPGPLLGWLLTPDATMGAPGDGPAGGLALAQPVPPHRPDRRLGRRRPAPRADRGRLAADRPRVRPACGRHPAASHPRALRLPRRSGLRGRGRHGPQGLVGQYGMRKCLGLGVRARSRTVEAGPVGAMGPLGLGGP